MRLLSKLAMLAVFATPALFALTCGGDTSGNATLKGSYRFRNIIAVTYDSKGNVTEVLAAYGVITFNGAGGYSASGTYVDNSSAGGSGKPQTLNTISACYAIGANGIGYIVNPTMLSVFGANYVLFSYGAVSQGVFAGTMSEAGQTAVADLFVAIPAGTPTNATFNAPYWTGFLDFTAGVSTNLKNGLFKLSPNGAGSLGGIVVNGQAANQNSGAKQTQTSSGGTYNFASDGTGTLSVAAPGGVSAVNALFTGAKTVYVSSDGGFVLGWSPTGYDIIFGVRTPTQSLTQSSFKGTYYTAAFERGTQAFCGNGVGVDAYNGSFSADGAGDEIVHQRLWSPECLSAAYDTTFDDYTTLNADGSLAKNDYASGYMLAFGNNGSAFVGTSGTAGFFSLSVGLQAPSLSGPGVFLNPVGVVNAGSYAPITAPVAPGELITLFGTGLAPATLVSTGGLPFPTSLGGVQVLVNNTPAPIYYVSSSQLSVIVPYGLASNTTGLAQIQVNSNGTFSNTVTLYATDALPGIFTQNQNGIGSAAALHADGSLVTSKSPAQAGEYVSIYLTGLGTVSPTVTDGSLGPGNPLSYADQYLNGYTQQIFQVNFNDYTNFLFATGNVTYAGLAPGLAGLYQLNVQIPTGVGPGDVYIEVITTDADVLQVTIPIASSAAVAAVPAARDARSPEGRRMPSPLARPPGIGLGRPRVPPQQQ